MTNRTLCASASIAAVLLAPAAARMGDSTKGTVDVVTVHGTSLEGNLTGDSPERRVSVYLPPSYEGNHVNSISERVARQVLPFFSANLVSAQGSTR